MFTTFATDRGLAHCLEQRFSLGSLYGRKVLSCRPQSICRVLNEFGDFESPTNLLSRDIIFLDTETTGFAGDERTIPFLIGIAWLEGSELRIEQLFVDDPLREGPCLKRLYDILQTKRCLVTYNGKSFDWPLLGNRFARNQLALPCSILHVDLLHIIRRVYHFVDQPKRLADIERDVLGLERDDDVAGEDIPASYLAYLRGAPPSSLKPIFEHNYYDIVSMVALVDRLAGLRAQPRQESDLRVVLGLARMWQAKRQIKHATRCARLVAADRRGRYSSDGWGLLADLAAEQGLHNKAATYFHRALEEGTPHFAHVGWIHLRLSTIYERHLRDFSAAYRHAQKTAGFEKPGAQKKRLLRLEKKLQCVTINLEEVP